MTAYLLIICDVPGCESSTQITAVGTRAVKVPRDWLVTERGYECPVDHSVAVVAEAGQLALGGGS